MITDENLHWWWKSHPFPWRHADAIKRRAEYWNWLATMIHDARYPKQHEGENDVRLYRYEALVANPKAVLNSFLTSLGRPRIEEAPKLRNMNQDDRYPRLDDIRQAVRQLCPIAKTLGYRVP